MHWELGPPCLRYKRAEVSTRLLQSQKTLTTACLEPKVRPLKKFLPNEAERGEDLSG